jgi:hypothetical protein
VRCIVGICDPAMWIHGLASLHATGVHSATTEWRILHYTVHCNRVTAVTRGKAQYGIALLGSVRDFGGAGGEKFLERFSFVRFQFPGRLSGLRLKLRCFGLDVSQFRIVAGFRRL